MSWAPPNWTALRSPPWAMRASPTPVGAVALLWGTPTPSSPLTPQASVLCKASLLGCYGNILYPSSPLVGNSAPIVIQSSLPVAPGQVCHVTCHMMCHMTVARCFVFGAQVVSINSCPPPPPPSVSIISPSLPPSLPPPKPQLVNYQSPHHSGPVAVGGDPMSMYSRPAAMEGYYTTRSEGPSEPHSSFSLALRAVILLSL